MKKLICYLLFGFLFVGAATAQRHDAPVPPEHSSLNKLDGRGKKHGIWLTTKEPGMGEPGINEFGNYQHGYKLGIWYKIDHAGELVAIESFRNNVLDGEVKYYDRGRLYCIGHYRGLNPKNAYDTIVITHPITQEEEYKVIATDQGSLRHGSWKYFDPGNGRLIKEEEYQVDELIFKKDYEVSAAADSIYHKKHEAAMPHNQRKRVLPPTGKKVSYSEY
ncbi:MAG TPA: hypothetical protein PL009_06260 [Flavipsychrobacter sp.]|nr:hypothetical protein [Flavipsychrobacter sp.]